MIKIKNKFVPGFTLLEVLVTVAIIGIMATVALVSTQRGKIDKEVSVAAEQVASSIREAQNYALSGKQPDATNTACGFGFRRSSANAYSVFYNHTTEDLVTCNAIIKYYSTTIPNQVSASLNSSGIILPNGVSFYNNASTGAMNSQIVYFLIPFAIVYNFDGDTLGAIKTIMVGKDSIYYAICVSPVGAVEVKKVEGDEATFDCDN
ncbi:MAG: hypothetical protein UR69_C0002G0124 [Candidatus Moranbacteria bacterium GW2011_GWE2_35_2-]|nr:MAG: hypothetical protein UR69_C0002G0124 [Candidatus Moranbacteria bacterium GW2011_GWE2_35_2-]KKQ06132.1 MAG: hypothetical protein US15_C0018G0015 [Candidatus Moranbacteria bacterium GW2011_GWF1_36_4]KKQ22526.1 MAG: hypothetical protein US37_C0002G0151 [Candidatus Moranbacteria bacterium GW2011_GWF2_37_11]KKQ29595.1 MAG: hypothetical protein US44_C0001G0187 [Candidatus Moranbacteria bacterium GW2011_GWD1_37_17]KKQ30534.1 MAG: hypothetical protein US47_C0002G0124 [Candidatus Moranbacteria b